MKFLTHVNIEKCPLPDNGSRFTTASCRDGPKWGNSPLDAQLNSMEALKLPALATLAERLMWARRQKRLTQQQLADAVDASREQIAAVESGRTKMPRKIINLAEVLEISPAWLQFGVEELDELSEESIRMALDIDSLDPMQRASLRHLISSLISK